MHYIRNGLHHVWTGTLGRQLRYKWRVRRKQRRLEWWDAHNTGAGFVDARVRSGYVIRLHFDSRLSRTIYGGLFEWHEQEFLRSFLKPGDIFIDVGANIGVYSLHAAQLVGTTGQVFSFEPSQLAFKRLCENVELNRLTNVTTLQIGLSDVQNAVVDMIVSKSGYDAWNSFAQSTAGHQTTVEQVSTTTLDEFMKTNNLVGLPTMIKIDVEGWESYVIRGGTEVLSRPDAPLLQVEFNDRTTQAGGTSTTELYSLLVRMGYEMKVLDNRTGRLTHQPPLASYPLFNLFALKPGSNVADRLRY